MRNILLSTLMIILSFTSLAQDSVLNKNEARLYRSKINYQKVAGRVLISAGNVGLFVTLLKDVTESLGESISVSVAPLFGVPDYQPEYKSYASAYLISVACIAGGICLLKMRSISKKNARATTMNMGMEKTELLKYGAVYNRLFPTISLKVRI